MCELTTALTRRDCVTVSRAILRKARAVATMNGASASVTSVSWADHILLLEGGKLIAGGKHEELLQSSDQYRRIFARYDAALPPVVATAEPSI